MSDNDAPLFCDRCSTELFPGKGNFYVVQIEAIADPSPPDLDDEDLSPDPRKEIERLVKQMSHLSQRELMDQVHRRLTIYLCLPCYAKWIENPTG